MLVDVIVKWLIQKNEFNKLIDAFGVVMRSSPNQNAQQIVIL